eukprot:5378498-Ditylum_brightwellii.AAC.2
MAMFLYVLRALPIVEYLKPLQICKRTKKCKAEQLQYWCTDNLADGGFFITLKEWYKELCIIGPPLRYHPELEKSILVTNKKNIGNAKAYFKEKKFKVKEGQ